MCRTGQLPCTAHEYIWLLQLTAYTPRSAASACIASSVKKAKKSLLWPKSPSSVKALTAPIAAPSVSVGRMIETGGNFRLRKMVGSGMIRLVCVAWLLRGIEVWEIQLIGGISQNFEIAGLVMPRLKVRYLGCTNTEQDAQHFHAADTVAPTKRRGWCHLAR